MGRIPLTIQKKMPRAVKDVRVNDKSVVANDIANVELKTINNKSIVGTGNITISGGGSGGTFDYDELNNKPSINNVELDGDLTLSDLGIAAADHEHNQYATATQLAGKQDTLVSGTNIATINDRSLLDGGNIVITGGGGGEGGTSNYDELSNKPKINDIMLAGNKSSSDLGLAALSHTHAADDISAGEISIDRLPVGPSTTQVANGAHSHSEYYTKPSAGIPKTDLASEVQTSLGKADSALQSVPDATSSVKGIAKLGASGGAAAYSHTHSGYVPTTRTVNDKALSADVTLTASDVGAAASSHTHTWSQIAVGLGTITDESGRATIGGQSSAGSIGIMWGTDKITVPAASYAVKDIYLTLNGTSSGTAFFDKIPFVGLTLLVIQEGSNGNPNRNLTLSGYSKTSFTARGWNQNASSTTLTFKWVAIGARPLTT